MDGAILMGGGIVDEVILCADVERMRTWVVGSLVLASCSPAAGPTGPAIPTGSRRDPSAAPVAASKLAPALPRNPQPWNFAGGPTITVKVDLSREVAGATELHFGKNVALYDGKN